MWGGRKLQTLLGKNLPANKPIGESWELYDFPPGVVEGSKDWVSSVIANGPYAGKTLHWLMNEFAQDLLGDAKPVGPDRQFPLLIKFLDAREDLSVQVHPDQAYADTHPGAHLKTEAWYVMQHDAGARLFKGLKPRTAKEEFRRAIQRGTVEQRLGTLPARIGDCHYLPSGTIHALGAGMLVAEVQTPSDTTFRVYDFNRIDPATGKPRALHVEQAMESIDFSDRANMMADQRTPTDSAIVQLVESPFFVMKRRTLRAGSHHQIVSTGPLILIVLDGEALLKDATTKEDVRIQRGQTVLLAASLRITTAEILTDCQWLEVTIPETGYNPLQ
jgi:mannose-6-phosphate isomerase